MKQILPLILLFIFISYACLWDSDTFKEERSKFPAALELITGRFSRHTTEYYHWRITDRETKLKDVNLSDSAKSVLIYDLAVAYDKTSNHKKAIELMHKMEKENPKRYETLANLGTFYIHNREFNKGLIYIKKAIQINPDAHFGREVYQKLLVEYILEISQGNKITLPLNKKFRTEKNQTFAHFVISRQLGDSLEPRDNGVRKEILKAQKGILGMMRFGDYKSPVLLEALGDLYTYYNDTDPISNTGYKHGIRAYIKASYESKEPKVKESYYDLARSLIANESSYQTKDSEFKLSTIEKAFQEELAAADEWYMEFSKQEKRWIKREKNVDSLYAHYAFKTPNVDSLLNTPVSDKDLTSKYHIDEERLLKELMELEGGE